MASAQRHSPAWLTDDDTAPFPPVDMALRQPDGLLALGGSLSPTRLLNAYRQGIFPWYQDGQPVLWWSPDPRMVLFPADLKVSRSLRKTLRHGGFEVSFDGAFTQVIEACADTVRPGQQGTWITRDMQTAYRTLYRLGYAHSVEVRRRDQLVGGLYGVAIGRVFFGESMFSRVPNASKVGFAALVKTLQTTGYRLIDCQVHTPHLESLGARPIPRREFVNRLERETCQSLPRQPWAMHPDVAGIVR